jgi:hypothetical protein
MSILATKSVRFQGVNVYARLGKFARLAGRARSVHRDFTSSPIHYVHPATVYRLVDELFPSITLVKYRRHPTGWHEGTFRFLWKGVEHAAKIRRASDSFLNPIHITRSEFEAAKSDIAGVASEVLENATPKNQDEFVLAQNYLMKDVCWSWLHSKRAFRTYKGSSCKDWEVDACGLKVRARIGGTPYKEFTISSVYSSIYEQFKPVHQLRMF